MPMFAEVGPIEMDEYITEQVDIMIANYDLKNYEKLIFDVMIDKIIERKDLKYPVKGRLLIKE